TELAKEATEAFIDAQKKMIDVAGKQVNIAMRAAGKTVNLVAPFPFIPIPDLTREGVKNFVSAEKALIDTVMHRPETKHASKATPQRKRPTRTIKMPAHAAVYVSEPRLSGVALTPNREPRTPSWRAVGKGGTSS